MCGAKGYGFFQPFWSEIEYQFWPFGLNRSLECFLHWSDLGYWFKGQVWNRVGKITYFGLKYGKGFRKRAAHLHPVFWKYPTGPEIGNPLSGIQIPKCLRFPHMRSSWGVGGEGGEGGGRGVTYVPRLNFKTCSWGGCHVAVGIFLLYLRFFFYRCRSFRPSLYMCRLSPYLLSCVAVSRPCRLSEFYPNRASHM